jgi:hypothetical protein
MATSIPSIPPPNLDPFENGTSAAASVTHQQIPELTTSQQVEQLQSSGESASAIAAALAMPVAQVDSDLGITSTPTAPTTVSIQA